MVTDEEVLAFFRDELSTPVSWAGKVEHLELDTHSKTTPKVMNCHMQLMTTIKSSALTSLSSICLSITHGKICPSVSAGLNIKKQM